MALVSLTTTSFANEPLWKKLYFRADGGVDFIQKTKNSDFKNSAVYGGGIGVAFNEMFRADLNFQRRNIHAGLRQTRSSILKKADSDSVFLNGYFNLTDFEYMTPYLTAGVGYISNGTYDTFVDSGNIRTFGYGMRSKGIAWNVGVGTTYALHEHLNLNFGYRFVNLGDFKFKNTGRKSIATNSNLNSSFNANSYNVKSHELTLGVIIKL